MMDRISGKRETLNRGRAASSFVDQENDNILGELVEETQALISSSRL